MLHSTLLTESAYGGGVQDPLSYLQAQPGSGGLAAGYLSTVHDYANGDFRPFWFNWSMHAAHRADCRVVHQAVTLSYNIAENLESYVIGQGYTYTAKSRSKVAGTDTALVAMVQRDIDRITRDNSFSEVDFSDAGHELGSMEAQIHNRSRRDGEDFIGIFSPTRGEIQLRTVNAEHVTDTHGIGVEFERTLGYRFAQCWKYGVHSADHDIQKALGYTVQWDTSGSDIDYFPTLSWEQAVRCRTGLMHHIKRNVDLKVKRGMSDFFPVAKHIVDDAKLLRNIVQGAQAQAAIAWIEQYLGDGVNKSQATSELNRTRGVKKATKTSVTESRSDFRRTLGPATVVTVDKGKQYLPGPMGSDRNNGFGLVAELSIRRIGLRWNMPEYMISSDASNGNRASTEVAEGPFGKARQKDQAFYCGHFRMVLWKAISILVAQGYYKAFGVYKFNDLLQKVGITVDAPNVSSRDMLAAAQSNDILHNAGVLSRKTWQVQAELDPNQEAENFKKEQPTVDAAAGQAGQQSDATAQQPTANVSALNGAQITAANDILTSVSAGATTEFVAQQLLVSLGVPASTATQMAKSAATIQQASQQPQVAPQPGQKMSEEDVQRIASRVQLNLWEDMERKATAYP